MSNNISNSNNVKTKITVMFAAIASVLIAGIGMNPAAYASILQDGFPEISMDDIGQSAECVGVLVECRENSDNIKVKNNNKNNNNNGNGGNGGNGDNMDPCDNCIATSLTGDERVDLSNELGIDENSSAEQICDTIGSDAITLYNALQNIGISDLRITAIFNCIGLELPVEQ